MILQRCLPWTSLETSVKVTAHLSLKGTLGEAWANIAEDLDKDFTQVSYDLKPWPRNLEQDHIKPLPISIFMWSMSVSKERPRGEKICSWRTDRQTDHNGVPQTKALVT